MMRAFTAPVDHRAGRPSGARRVVAAARHAHVT